RQLAHHAFSPPSDTCPLCPLLAPSAIPGNHGCIPASIRTGGSRQPAVVLSLRPPACRGRCSVPQATPLHPASPAFAESPATVDGPRGIGATHAPRGIDPIGSRPVP